MTNSAEPFEIKVALLGHVSVGKTTLLNALFRDKFGEVSLSRTTAAVNHYRVSQCDSSSNGSDSAAFVTATEALDTNVSDNRTLRESSKLEEKTFDIQLDEPLFEMRNDTRLVLVDIPGVNEARTEKIYLDYVKKAWDTFDCVVVVMDARAGVNTDEMVDLLGFVKENLDRYKKVPVIILCNKVDDMDDPEVMGLAEEVRREVERIFEVDDRNKALASLLSASDENESLKFNSSSGWSPAFLPISAEWAFLYGLVSKLDLEGLGKLSVRHLDKIGHAEEGVHKWKELELEDKVKVVHRVVQDQASYQQRLSNTNFDKFVKTLERFVGGNDTQADILQKQNEASVEKIQASTIGFADELNAFYDRSVALGKESSASSFVKTTFWRLLKELTEEVFVKLSNSPANLSAVHLPMQELITYARKLIKKFHPSDEASESNVREEQLVAVAMINLFKRQVGIILNKAKLWQPSPMVLCMDHTAAYDRDNWIWDNHEKRWRNETTFETIAQHAHPNGAVTSDKPEGQRKHSRSQDRRRRSLPKEEEKEKVPLGAGMSSWEILSPPDWHAILSSVLCLRHDRNFCEHCSSQITALEWIAQYGTFTDLRSCTNCPQGKCRCEGTKEYYRRALEGSYNDDGVFVPDDEKLFRKVVHVTVPDSLSSPNHWGHLGWLFCNFVESDGPLSIPPPPPPPPPPAAAPEPEQEATSSSSRKRKGNDVSGEAEEDEKQKADGAKRKQGRRQSPAKRLEAHL